MRNAPLLLTSSRVGSGGASLTQHVPLEAGHLLVSRRSMSLNVRFSDSKFGFMDCAGWTVDPPPEVNITDTYNYSHPYTNTYTCTYTYTYTYTYAYAYTYTYTYAYTYTSLINACRSLLAGRPTNTQNTNLCSDSCHLLKEHEHRQQRRLAVVAAFKAETHSSIVLQKPTMNPWRMFKTWYVIHRLSSSYFPGVVFRKSDFLVEAERMYG
jgi:hypothetical protein